MTRRPRIEVISLTSRREESLEPKSFCKCYKVAYTMWLKR